MNGLEPQLTAINECGTDSESTSTTFTFLFLLVYFAAATYALARFAESQNKLNYESRFARIIAGALALMTRMLHLKKEEFEINTEEGALIAIGPHRTGLLDGLAVASRIKGAPPRFFATDAYNSLPGVAQFLKMFLVIPIFSIPQKCGDGRTANADAIELASKALDEKGCVALFPQGNLSKIDGKIPRIYSGAAGIAVRNNKPIHVIRLDGFWCLQNSLLPLSIRNNDFYRALLTVFHLNNISTTLCCVIDVHLKPENAHMSTEQKMEEISAQLHAYYRHTGELTERQIGTIKTEIAQRTHLLIWQNKVQQDKLEKELSTLKKGEIELVKPTLALMN